MNSIRVNLDKTTNYLAFTVGQHTFYVSYSTLVAYQGPLCPEGVRTDTHHSKTTSKHLTQMRAKDFRQSSADLEGIIAMLDGMKPVFSTSRPALQKPN